MSKSLTGAGSVFSKTIASLTSIATVLSLSGFAMLAPVANAATPSDYGLHEGDTISATGSNDPDVYIVNQLGFKRLFLNPVIFSFYGHLGGFANVKHVTPATRDAFPTSGLFRNCETNDQAVWAVEVNGEDTAVLHHVAISGDAAVAQDSNFFKKVFCINNNEFAWYTKSSVDYTSLSQVPVYSRTPGSTPTPTYSGAVSVSLASDNPASGTLVKSQASADLAHFMFTGSGVVTNIKLNRLGVSADTDLSNVYLYDGSKRLTDAATVSNGVITFNDTSSTGLFMVSGSKTVSVRADLSSNSGEIVGIQLASFNGTTVNLSGNLFTVANASLGTVVLANAATPSTNPSLDPASDTVIWQDTATVGTRYAWLKSLQLRVIGSVYVGDLQNFRLFVDGVQVGSAVAQSDANGYVVFDLANNPLKMETGGRIVKVLADVVNGSSRNFTASLRQAPDFFTVDSQYNQPILATVNTGSFPDSAGQQTITSGTLTITKTNDSPSGDVVKGSSGVALARFELKANGERMKVESLRVNNTTGSGALLALRNGALFVDGVQVGSTQTIWEDSSPVASSSAAYTEFSLGSSLVVEPGHPKTLEVRADVYDASGTDNTATGQTFTINIAVGPTSGNVQRLTSLGYVQVPSGVKSANQLTIKTGSLSIGKYSGYANQSVTSPATSVKVGHFTLTQSSSEDININTINIDGDSVTGSFIISDLTDAYIKVWNDAGSVVYTSPSKATLSATASNSYSVNFVLPKTKTYQVEVWANVPSGETATHALTLDMDATGITTGSSTSVASGAVVGQTITVQTGSLTTNNGALPVPALRAGGTTVDAYQFTLQPAYDDFTLDEVYVDLSSTVASSVGAVANLQLFEGSTMVSSTTVSSSTGSASFTGLNRLLTQSAGTKTYTVKAQLANVGSGANDTYGTVVVRLDGMKYRTSNGSITTTNGLSATTYTGNDNRVVKAYPTFTNVALDNSPLGTGEQTLLQSTVAGNGGIVSLYALKFDITTTNGPTFTAATDATLNNNVFKLYANGTDITSLGTFASSSATNLTAAGAHTGYVRFVFTNEYPISSPVTLKFTGNVSAIGSNYQAITTKLANPKSATPVVDDASTTAGTISSTSASVVWSDQSTVGHSTSTDDWMNDYLVSGINVSQTRAISQ